MGPDIRLIVDDSCRDMVGTKLELIKRSNMPIMLIGKDIPLPDQFFDIKLVRDGDISRNRRAIYPQKNGGSW